MVSRLGGQCIGQRDGREYDGPSSEVFLADTPTVDEDSSQQGKACPECGARLLEETCSYCAMGSRDTTLQLVGDGLSKVPGGVSSSVRLLRELKIPTVKGLLTSSSAELDLLPGKVRAVERAACAGKLEEADQRMDEAVGSMFLGPGSDRRPAANLLSTVLWVWLAVLVLVFGLMLL